MSVRVREEDFCLGMYRIYNSENQLSLKGYSCNIEKIENVFFFHVERRVYVPIRKGLFVQKIDTFQKTLTCILQVKKL